MNKAVDQTVFNTGLCDWHLDATSCLDGVCCPWCEVARQYNMIAHEVRDTHTLMCCGLLFCDLFLTFGLSVTIGEVVVRAESRHKLGITSESGCGSCMRAFCCGPCSTCQVYRELSMRGMWPGGVCSSAPFKHPLFISPPPIQQMFPPVQPLPFPQGGNTNALPHYPVQGGGAAVFQGQPVYYGQPMTFNPPREGSDDIQGRPMYSAGVGPTYTSGDTYPAPNKMQV